MTTEEIIIQSIFRGFVIGGLIYVYFTLDHTLMIVKEVRSVVSDIKTELVKDTYSQDAKDVSQEIIDSLKLDIIEKLKK